MGSRQGGRASRRRRGAAVSVLASVATTALIAGCGVFGAEEPERRPGSTGTAETPTTEPERRAGSAGTAETPTATSRIAVGDCIDDPGMEDHSDIAVIPCDEQHVFEAFATTQMPEGEYPGQGGANTAATDFCAEEFESFIGVDYDTSVLELLYFYPVEESWDAEGDRKILCFVAEQEETPVTGTLRDAGR
ncbi:septum formation family protein [Arthrobacter sp. SX1312]|uniref:septum formation family protein n=1 Tax=Arthrobacter sp. SX1312 TaxID=2058896 RepID=UPI000CE31D79|nr:septum formation family protein [Arthrobacter sp. SX1312]